jgi:hypothetical protein
MFENNNTFTLEILHKNIIKIKKMPICLEPVKTKRGLMFNTNKKELNLLKEF